MLGKGSIMLVLSRKAGEKLVLGPFPDGTYITVMVVSVRGDRVRLGVDAPKSVQIVRSELLLKDNKGVDDESL